MNENNNEPTSSEKFTGTMPVQEKLKFSHSKLESYLNEYVN